MGKIICIASGKGGVGKTTSVVNLGIALNKFGYDTIIVDGNINTPDLGMHLGMPTTGVNLHDVLTKKKSIFESVYIHPNGTKVVPAGINMWGLLKLSRDKLSEINKLKNYSDIILLDSSPGINDEAEACIKASDEVLIITNPDIPSVTDALKTIALAKKLNKPVIGAIVNRHANKKYEMSIGNIRDFLGVPIISVVPVDEKVYKSLSMRKTVIEAFPFSKASIGFKKAAAYIIGQDYEVIEKPSIIKRIIKVFKK